MIGRLISALVASAVLVACASPGAPTQPSDSVQASATGPIGLGSLPPGCETISLRAPDGSPIRLDGTWIDVSRDDAGRMTWWIRTQGDCFYGVGSVDDVPEDVISENLTVDSLRRFKDDATEVREGFECGIGIGYNDLKVGDIIETYEMKEKPRE